MRLHRQALLAFLLLTAVVYIFLSPLLPLHGVAGRHHAGSTLAAAVLPPALALLVVSFFLSPVPEKRAFPLEKLFTLHCARLC